MCNWYRGAFVRPSTCFIWPALGVVVIIKNKSHTARARPPSAEKVNVFVNRRLRRTTRAATLAMDLTGEFAPAGRRAVSAST